MAKKKKIKSHETRKILAFGERIRENPDTILLSVPVFAFGYLFYRLIGDNEGIAGSLGHCGIVFKNYYKHRLKWRFLQKCAYYLFNKSANYASGEGKASTIHHAASMAGQLGNYKLAEEKFNEALEVADSENAKHIKGYIHDHVGLIMIKQGKLSLAKKHLEKAKKLLLKEEKIRPNSMYIQVWLSSMELSFASYFLAKKDKSLSRKWLEKARERVEKYNLKARMLDVNKLREKIENA